MRATSQHNFISVDHDARRGFSSPPAIEFNPGQGAIHLQRNQYLHLHDALGWTVRSLDGTVWITQDGDVRDIVIEAGQAFVLDRNGSALVAPMGAAAIGIEFEPGTARSADRAMAAQFAPPLSAVRTLFA